MARSHGKMDLRYCSRVGNWYRWQVEWSLLLASCGGYWLLHVRMADKMMEGMMLRVVTVTSGVCLRCVDAGLPSIPVAFDALGLRVATRARWG